MNNNKKSKHIFKTSSTIGLPPGALVYVGEEKAGKVKITVLDYDENRCEEKDIQSIEECFPFKDTTTTTWINVDGIDRLDVIEKIDKHFGIHPLVLEDIVNTEQRPKMEDYGNYLFIVLKMLYEDKKSDKIVSEQISIIVGSNYVISFQETEGGDIFNHIRDRIRNAKGRLRRLGADYLTYALLDTIVDHYFLILEELGREIEVVDEELMADASLISMKEIHYLKRDLIFLRRNVWPVREILSNLQRTESRLIKKATNIFLRDVYDHTIQVIDTVESYRDMIASMTDIYMTAISNKLNEVMKFLTVITTIFIPLSFIAGIYGMNFKFMPELEWRGGYFVVLGIMMISAGLMVVYFKRKKWI